MREAAALRLGRTEQGHLLTKSSSDRSGLPLHVLVIVSPVVIHHPFLTNHHQPSLSFSLSLTRWTKLLVAPVHDTESAAKLDDGACWDAGERRKGAEEREGEAQE